MHIKSQLETDIREGTVETDIANAMLRIVLGIDRVEAIHQDSYRDFFSDIVRAAHLLPKRSRNRQSNPTTRHRSDTGMI